jgi:hypothetical protein
MPTESSEHFTVVVKVKIFNKPNEPVKRRIFCVGILKYKVTPKGRNPPKTVVQHHCPCTYINVSVGENVIGPVTGKSYFYVGHFYSLQRRTVVKE